MLPSNIHHTKTYVVFSMCMLPNYDSILVDGSKFRLYAVLLLVFQLYDARKDLFAIASFLNVTFNEMCFILSDNRIANISAKACYEILAARTNITHSNNIYVNN